MQCTRPTLRSESRRRGGRFGLLLIVAAAGCAPPAEADNPERRAKRFQRPQRALPVLAADRIGPPVEVEVRAIPQDPAAQARRRAAQHEALRRDFVNTYERHGRTDPRWDAAAHTALEAAARFFALSSGIGDEQVVAWKAARQAVAAGCDDPSIHYLIARFSYGECAVPLDDIRQAYDRAVFGVRRGKYPALKRAFTLQRAGYYRLVSGPFGPEPKQEAIAMMEEALGLFPEVWGELRDGADQRQTAYDLGMLLLDGYFQLIGDRRRSFEKVAAAIGNDVKDRSLLLILEGYSSQISAWEMQTQGTSLRGTDLQEAVTTRLVIAEKALTEAWQLAPTESIIPRIMLEVVTGLGQGRDQLELWFERAMRLNGDDYAACLSKLNYLEPRWYGSEAEMLAFGRACVKTGNWEARLPFILVEAHERLSAIVTAAEAYDARPYVWQDIQAVYGPYLALHPTSQYDRSNYARLAGFCQQHGEALRLFDELGDDYWRSTFGSENEYRRLRERTRQRAARK